MMVFSGNLNAIGSRWFPLLRFGIQWQNGKTGSLLHRLTDFCVVRTGVVIAAGFSVISHITNSTLSRTIVSKMLPKSHVLVEASCHIRHQQMVLL
jgi:hypothetical protein